VLASAVDPDGEAARPCEMFSRVIRRSRRDFCARPRTSQKPKLDNLVAPFTQATYDTILMKDANAILEPDDLASTCGN